MKGFELVFNMRHLDFIHAEGGEGKKCSAGEGSLRGGGRNKF